MQRKINIEVTTSALKRIGQLLEKQILEDNSKAKALRISVIGGGCSGFSYKYEFIADPEQQDYIFQQDGIIIAIDDISKPYLEGSTVDFVEELGNAYFNIINPQAKLRCGCGNSFSL